MHESPVPLGECVDVRRLRLREQLPVGADALVVVEVQHPADRSAQRYLVRAGREGRRAGGVEQVGPALRSGVEVVEVEARFVHELGEADVGAVAAQRSQLVDLGGPSRRDGLAEAPQHDLGGLLVELHVAADRKERELHLHGPFDVSPGAAEQRTVAAVEPELLAMGADEVQHRAERLALRLAQPATELLEEQRRTLGRSQHQDGVDGRHVDALVEQVDREHDLHVAGRELPQRRLPLGPRTVAPDRDGTDPVLVEVSGHELGVLDAHAEAEARIESTSACSMSCFTTRRAQASELV